MKRIFIIFLLSLACGLRAQVVNVEDFGAKADSFQDAVEGVRSAIEACKQYPEATLFFPKGRYDFWPDRAEKREYYVSNTTSETECPSKVKNIGLLFEELKNLTVEGNGSLFVFHGKMITWAADRCENIRFRNFSVDFERPTMSELTFREVSPRRVVAEVHPDSRYALADDKLFWYGYKWFADEKNYFSILTDTTEGAWRYSSFAPLNKSKIRELAPCLLEFEGDFSQTNYQPGKTLTTRDHIRDHVGVFIHLSKNVSLENIAMHYMHGLGIVSQFSENLTYTGVRIIPSRGRTVAGFADGMHFSGCKGYIRVEDCHFKGLHDDPMNIHGTFLQIREVHSPTSLTVRFMHGQTYGFPAFFEGDTVGFVQSDLIRTLGKAVVKSATRLSEREVRVELSKALPKGMDVGDCLENLTWTPSLEVRGCRFEMTNTRGLLITTPKKVVVENNHFYRTGMYAIQIACDAGSWYESGEVRDVLIQHNIFEECGYNRMPDDSYAIAVNPENHRIMKGHWVHRNIRILNNTFKTVGGQVLKAKSTDGLAFENNSVEYSDWPVTSTQTGNEQKPPAFLFDNCTRVRLEANELKLKAPIRVETVNMNKKDIQCKIKT